MTKQPELLPSWNECKRRIGNEQFCKEYGHTQTEEEKPTPLHRFIYEQEPEGGEQEKTFRELLSNLLIWNTRQPQAKPVFWPTEYSIRHNYTGEVLLESNSRDIQYQYGYNEGIKDAKDSYRKSQI